VVPAPAAVATDARPVLVAFGDSLSAGFGVEAGLSYPDFLQKEIDAKGLGYRVVNLGISGDTTSGGLSRVEAAVALKPKVVILELGGNDGLRGLPLSQTKANLAAMADRFTAAGAKVVIAGMTLPPNYGPDYVRQFEAIYVDLARERKLTRIRFLLDGVWNVDGMMQPDGIHATAKGNAEVARRVMQTVEPLLR
jgi:acyl-CoA thioesterase I